MVGEVAGVGVFEEGAVWGAFAGCVVAVGGVEGMSIKRELGLADSLCKGNILVYKKRIFNDDSHY